MALEGVPWAVDHAEHSAEVARLLGFAATGGSEGVIAPGDFKVTASGIPDDEIHVAPGAAVALNRGEGGASQSYLIRNVSDTIEALTPQGAGGVRYDLICVIVEDPQYAGMPDPVSVPDGPYVRIAVYEDVTATTRYLSEVDADQTGYALARVKFDASDGTVTNGDITDLRELVQPRRKEEVLATNPPGDTALAAALAVNPSTATKSVFVPSWATHVLLEGHWSGVVCTDVGLATGFLIGSCRVNLGSVITEEVVFRADATAAAKPITVPTLAAQEVAIPPELRGTTQNLQGMLKYITQSSMTGKTDQYSSALIKAVFVERVV